MLTGIQKVKKVLDKLDLIMYIYNRNSEVIMAQRKTKEFIANEMNLDMLDHTISIVNKVADAIRDNFDMEEVGNELVMLFRHTERGLERIPEQRDEFAFTMVCKAIPMDGRHRKIYEYRFRLNTYTNEVTCLDKDSNGWTMPLLNDALSVIREKAIQVAMS